jgi:UDP-glucose 4-epimerase
VKRVLVTGGSGFIGSHVVDALEAARIEPRIIDLRAPDHLPPGRVDTVIGDLLDADTLWRAMEGCDAVIHLAAAADVDAVAEDPEGAERVNARGTLAVLEVARAVDVSRVIYGSTIWVYGQSGEGVLDEGARLGLPQHLYTASKLAGEMYCAAYAELYGVSCTILRFGIPYGPRARPSAVIPTFVRMALAGEPLTLAGDGSQTRRFVYVEDLADGIVRALDPCAANRIYNLSSDETVTIRELVQMVGELVGDVEVVRTPERAADFDGAGISSRRAERELGWRASTTLREGMARYMSWLGNETGALKQPVNEATLAKRASEPSTADRTRPRLYERLAVTPPITALACAIGTLIPYALAHRMDEFDTAQVHSVGITTLVAILVCLSAVQTRSARQVHHAAAIAWLLSGYVALVLLPWTKALLDLAVPEVQTLIMSAIGTTMALGVAGAANRLRSGARAAPERAI